ncbi:nuclear transport factor 2 family protein [Microbacterium sp. AGC62]|uniref:nuclear transport factor 2 family protein n=1 Tax=unclassified Microbacterium TaxID=2609290 RepID=UPI00068C1C8B|nr:MULTISPECIES: nuclear transport factor 2 family protein [unclassified Microbacterium]
MSEALERRLQVLEDRAEIADLIARYGPAADSGDADAVAALWAPGGTYQFDDTVLEADDIRSLVSIPTHVEYMRRGCAHIVSAPRIEIDGDDAVAVTHSVVMLREGERWIGERVSANRWELRRTADGWRVQRRRNRLLDGDGAARELLAR